MVVAPVYRRADPGRAWTGRSLTPGQVAALGDYRGGGFRFDADVPASNIPGSYATYTEEVDAEGVTTMFYKTTYGPERRVIHVKVKYP